MARGAVSLFHQPFGSRADRSRAARPARRVRRFSNGTANRPIRKTQATFFRAKLNHEVAQRAGDHLVLLKFYRELIDCEKRFGVRWPLSNSDMRNVPDSTTERVYCRAALAGR